MFGNRYRSILRAPEGDAPAGGTTSAPSGAAPAATAPPPAANPLDDPAVKAAIKAAEKSAREAAKAEAAKAAEDEKRLAQLDAEARAKAEKAAAEKERDAAREEAKAARLELEVARSMAALELKPQDDEAAALATGLAQKLVDAGTSWADAFSEVAKTRGYLFAKTGSQSQPAPTQQQTTRTPGSTPAQVAAARTATTGPTAPPTDQQQPRVADAYALDDEAFAKAAAKIMATGQIPTIAAP